MTMLLGVGSGERHWKKKVKEPEWKHWGLKLLTQIHIVVN